MIVARADVRVLADLGVADVRQVRHLRALADARVLDLHERACLRARLEHRAGAKVTERADESHRGRSRRRPRRRAGRPRRPRRRVVAPRRTVNGWIDRVGLERRPSARSRSSAGSTIVTPASMCAALIRSRSDGGGGGELDARVDALGLGGIGGDVRRRRARPPSTRSRTASVRYSSPCAFARLEPLERRPERARRGRRRSRSSPRGSRARSGDGVARLDDRLERAVVVADDAAVARGCRRARTRGRSPPRPRARCVSTSALEQLGREQRRVAGEDEHVAVDARERSRARRAPRRRCRAARSWTATVDALERVGACRARRRRRAARAPSGARGLDDPVDHPPAEQRVEVLRRSRSACACRGRRP